MDMGAPPSEEAISSSQAELERLLAGPDVPAFEGATPAVAIVVVEDIGVTSEELPVAVPIAVGERVSVAAEAPAIEVGTVGTGTGPSEPPPVFPSGTIPDSASGPPVGSPAADAVLPVGAQGVVLIEDSPPTASTDLASPSTAVGGSLSGTIPEVGERSGGPSLAPSEPPGGLPLPVLGTSGTSMGSSASARWHRPCGMRTQSPRPTSFSRRACA